MAWGWNCSICQLGSKFLPVIGLMSPAATRLLPVSGEVNILKGMLRWMNVQARHVPASPCPMMENGGALGGIACGGYDFEVGWRDWIMASLGSALVGSKSFA